MQENECKLNFVRLNICFGCTNELSCIELSHIRKELLIALQQLIYAGSGSYDKVSSTLVRICKKKRNAKKKENSVKSLFSFL